MDKQEPIIYSCLSDEVIRQRRWTEEELRAMGYQYFDRIKEITMARVLSPTEAPLTIPTNTGDSLTAEAGYYICYQPGDTAKVTLNQYDHWPVEPTIFERVYKPWDVPDWQPNSAEKHLILLGCKPYFKAVGVWAKKLDEPAFVQSLESARPIRVASGQYVLIGSEGEPYSVGESTLMKRYRPPEKSTVLRVIRRFLGLS